MIGTERASRLKRTHLGYIIAAALGLWHCRSFEGGPPIGKESDGSTSSGGSDGHGAGAAGIGGQGAEPAGGSSTVGAGSSGEGDAGATGTVDGGDGNTSAGGGNEAGSTGGGPNTEPPPSSFGTVFLKAGERQCAGTLWTNRWVITADHCVPFSIEPSELVVTLAGDLRNPIDVQIPKRIVRYPGNTANLRSRDIVLLELGEGMLVNGQRSGYFMNVYPRRPLDLFGIGLRCVGWGLDADAGAPRFARQRDLWVDDIRYTENESDMGDQVILGSDSANISPLDEGGSCFVGLYGVQRQVILMTGPARGLNLSEDSVLKWLFDSATITQSASLPSVSDNVASVLTPSGTELYWVSPEGALWMNYWPPVGEPIKLTENGKFQPLRPAGQWLGNSRLLVAVSANGAPSYAVANDDDLGHLKAAFQPIGMAITKSGLSIVRMNPADVRLFIRGENDELRMSTFDGQSWSGWVGLGGELASAPSAAAWSDQRIDIFARGLDNNLVHRYFDAKRTLWEPWEIILPGIRGTPVVSSWGKHRLDLLVKVPDGGRYHIWYDRTWYWYMHDLGTSTDLDDEPAMISPYPGKLSFLDPDPGVLHGITLYSE